MWAASLLCWLYAASARAEYPGSFPVRLSGGLVGGLGGGEAGAMAAGRALLRGGRFALEGAAREGWYFTPSRSVGALFLGARYLPSGPAFARVGLAHHHEVPQAAFLAAPGGAIAGTAEGIHHRSGFERIREEKDEPEPVKKVAKKKKIDTPPTNSLESFFNDEKHTVIPKDKIANIGEMNEHS